MRFAGETRSNWISRMGFSGPGVLVVGAGNHHELGLSSLGI